ncbi:MAG: shikimate kinase [Deltaproteobacteria bacterium]|nr:shikimate kinase [Deltaproteobacteria bacterium]
MNLILTGFMGTGKSTVARRLAAVLSMRHVDTDDMVEASAGRKIKDIFASEGEAAFRALEREALKDALLGDGAVVSTGGGALVTAESRAIAKTRGTVVCLTATVETILKRVGRNDERPLLKGSPDDVRARITELLDAREEAYLDAHIVVDTTSKSVDEVISEIRRYIGR